MNQKIVLFHLREASEQLNETIQALASDTDYDVERLCVEMSLLYLHLNTAWNGRDQTDKQFIECTDHDFAQFRKFPTEELLLD